VVISYYSLDLFVDFMHGICSLFLDLEEYNHRIKRSRSRLTAWKREFKKNDG